MKGVTYDTGALVAAERNDRRMWALHAGFLAVDAVPVVPAAVLAQAWRGGGRQASLVRLLAPCRVEPLTEEIAREVGALAASSGHYDVVDVSVVAGASRRRDVVITSDPADLGRVAEAAGYRPRLVTI